MKKDKTFICKNITSNENGHLCFAGQDTVCLAEKYGTPLYLIDEDRIRENCRVFTKAFTEYFGSSSYPVYASKACCIKKILNVITEEGLGTDLVSPGEIATAVAADADLKRAYFHGNDKTDEDIRYAIGCGVGYFVAESEEEAYAIDAAAKDAGIRQDIILRLTPGIDPHTYEAMNTGKVDSKFGIPIETGQASEALETILRLENIRLRGFHCHVGSSVFAENVFERTGEIMIDFIAYAQKTFGYTTEILNLGGGFGVRYVDNDPYLDIASKIRYIAGSLKESCKKYSIDMPSIVMEPGRSIIADAGMTLYTAGSVKEIKGYKKYISVNGGMSDNPRYALYGSKYSCIDASKADEPCDEVFDLVGRCCESGDIIQPRVEFPHTIKRGDIIAVCTTGAYNYAMASNYNRIPRPALVMLKGGDSYTAVRRETLDDLIGLDI